MDYGMSGKKIEMFRGALMQEMGRDVSWAEFAYLAGVSHHTIKNIRHGRSNGSTRTVQQVVSMLREHGVEVRAEDLLTPV